jgi:hypothetical protein
MSAGRLSLALLMKITALVAIDLALIGSDIWLLGFPVFLFLVVALNLVIAQGVILGRPLHAFHFTFLLVSTIFSIAILAILPRSGLMWVTWRLTQRYDKFGIFFSVNRILRLFNSGFNPEILAGLIV